MTTCCDDSEQYWRDRIATVKALIDAYDAALLALGTGAVQQYSLDTGQTRQTVTKANMATLRDTRDGLLDEPVGLQARCGGGGSRVVPGWP